MRGPFLLLLNAHKCCARWNNIMYDKKGFSTYYNIMFCIWITVQISKVLNIVGLTIFNRIAIQTTPRYQHTLETLTYREYTCTILSITLPYEILGNSISELINTAIVCTQSADRLLYSIHLWSCRRRHTF